MTQQERRGPTARQGHLRARSATLAVIVAALAGSTLTACSAGAQTVGAAAPVELTVPADVATSSSPVPTSPTEAPPTPGDATSSSTAAPRTTTPRPVPVPPTRTPARTTASPAAGEAAAVRSAASRSSAAARSSAARLATRPGAAPAAAGPAGTTVAATAAPAGAPLLLGPAVENTAEAEVVRLVNTHRTAAGCPAVTVDPLLVELARAHSQDMSAAAGFKHNGSDGRTPFQRMTGAGYDYSVAAENIAAGQPNASAVMAAWMASPGYQANILDCRLTEIGVGVVNRPGTPWVVYWTQDFASPM